MLSDGREPFVEWQHSREKDPGPMPEGDLDTIEGLRAWLSHPANWVKTDLFIVIWDGYVPQISYSHAYKLAPASKDGVGLLQVILADRRRRKTRPKTEREKEEADDV